MRFFFCFLNLCTIIFVGTPKEIYSDDHFENVTSYLSKKESSIPILIGTKPKIEFPSKATDVSTPIIVGDDPKKSKLPPKVFPKKPGNGLVEPNIVSGIDTSAEVKSNITIKNVLEANLAQENITTKKQMDKVEGSIGEQEDMLQNKYKGGLDVDELMPRTDNYEGHKAMNGTKVTSRESMLESTSKIMAVSSSVFASTQPKQLGIIEAGKTLVTFLLTAVALLCFGAIGILVWKRIAMRKTGRGVLINEDDFDEVADMHTFDRAQILIT